jgi:hypothetical protein
MLPLGFILFVPSFNNVFNVKRQRKWSHKIILFPEPPHHLKPTTDLNNRKTHKHIRSISKFPAAWAHDLVIPFPAVNYTKGVCFGLLLSWNPTCKPQLLAADVTSSLYKNISFPFPVRKLLPNKKLICITFQVERPARVAVWWRGLAPVSCRS